MAPPSSEQRGFNRLLVAGYLAGAWGGLVWLYAYAPRLAWVMRAELAMGEDVRNAILVSTAMGALAWTLIFIQAAKTRGWRAAWLLPAAPLALAGPILAGLLVLACGRGACL